MQTHDPKTDLSPKFIFWFTFFVYFTFWAIITIMIFGDYSTKPVELDQFGHAVDPEAFQTYILRGERTNADFPINHRILVSLFLGAVCIFWMVRIQVEMFILRKATKVARKFINK
jgi:hypothetical protein